MSQNEDQTSSTDSVSKSAWQARYDEGRTGWDRGGPNPQLLTWLEQAAIEPCRILIPCCGHGHEAIALAELGFEVTAIDFADTAVESLRQRSARGGLAVEVFQSDVLAFQTAKPFDAIYEQTCLCALHPQHWQAYADCIQGWLHRDGKVLAFFMQSGTDAGPPYQCTPEQMRDVFPLNRWQWPETLTRVEHPTGMHELAGILVRKYDD